MGILVVDIFDFPRKMVNRNFGQFDFSNSVLFNASFYGITHATFYFFSVGENSSSHNLDDFISMDPNLGVIGDVLNLTEFVKRFFRT